MRVVMLLLFAVVVTAARADSWVPARPASGVSPNGNLVVRITPGESLGDVFGYAGAKKGRYAKAVFYRLHGEDRYVKFRELQLLNPIAPVDFVLSNQGELMTFDNWHNLGIRQVIVVYGRDGGVTRTYSLEDIYAPNEWMRFGRSTSSVDWRCPLPPALDGRMREVEFADRLGNVVSINVESGALSKRHVGSAC